MKSKLLSLIIFLSFMRFNSFGQVSKASQPEVNNNDVLNFSNSWEQKSGADLNTDSCTGLILQPGPAKGKDAFIQHLETNSEWDDDNYGNYHSFEAMAWTWGDPGVLRSLVEFDLSTIPINAVISDAKLSLYNDPTSNENSGQHSSLSGSNVSLLQRITSSWSESAVTWSNQPTTTNLNEVILPQSISAHQDYPNIDVTAIVNDMVHNPSSSFGFMFKLVTESHWRCMIFASSDHPDSTKHPKLEICYTVPTSVNDLSSDNGMYIYPNPSSGVFSIAWNYQESDFKHFQIINCFGQIVLDQRVSFSQNFLTVNVEDKAKGVYFAILTGDHHRSVKKLIVQ